MRFYVLLAMKEIWFGCGGVSNYPNLLVLPFVSLESHAIKAR